MLTQHNKSTFLAGIAFVLYVVLLALIMSHHELWGDELHSWNIVKGSPGFLSLLHNIRYEGHPPLWYVILWPLSRMTHQLAYIQVLHFMIASAAVFILLFLSPLPVLCRILVCFGYLFLFEYAALSRNYAIGVLLALGLCLLLQPRDKPRFGWYYLLLFLLSNTHLIGLVLAASIHLYVWGWRSRTWQHAVAGLLVLLPAAWFILPPPDSQLNAGFWMNHWSGHQLSVLAEAPLRAFLPIPAWWEYHFWNTQFLLEAGGGHGWVVLLGAACSIAFCVVAYRAVRGGAGTGALFLINLGLTLAVGFVFPLTTARYTGFIFIGFLVAYWLREAGAPRGTAAVEHPEPIAARRPILPSHIWVCLLLALQIPGAFLAGYRDIRLPFSLAYEAPAMAGEVPPGEHFCCDYWALNPLAAYADKPFYCLDLQKELAFLKWNGDFAITFHNPHRYADGVAYYFQREGIRQTYLLSTAPAAELERTDSSLFRTYSVKLLDLREGAIEKGSNLYLYLISLPTPPPPLMEPVSHGHP